MGKKDNKVVPIATTEAPKIDKAMLLQQRLDSLMKDRANQQAGYLGQMEQLKMLRKEMAEQEKFIIHMNGEIGELERIIKFLKET